MATFILIKAIVASPTASPCPYIKLRAVSWTAHNAALQGAFYQGTPHMGAFVGNGVAGTGQVHQQDFPTFQR